MGDRRVACRVLVGRPDRRNYLVDLGIDGTIILKLILKRLDG